MNLFDFVFPQSCFGCGKRGNYICASCIERQEITKPICPECGRPTIRGMVHPRCRKQEGLDGLVSLWRYKGAVRRAIVSLKYKFAKKAAFELAGHAEGYLAKQKIALPSKPTLAPIPLFWFRQHWRGFNQSEEVGKLLAEKIGWDFKPGIIRRKISRTPQVQLRGRARRKNVRGVFAVNPQVLVTIDKKSVILFDDVWTTGATIKEAAKVLKICLHRQRNGANQVWGLTLARSE